MVFSTRVHNDVEGEGPNILVLARLNSLVINRSCTRACTVAQGKTRGREYNTRANGTKTVIGPIIRDVLSRVVLC